MKLLSRPTSTPWPPGKCGEDSVIDPRLQVSGRADAHTLRHTRATWLMQRGVDADRAAAHLGMSRQQNERAYAKHHPDFQKDAAEI